MTEPGPEFRRIGDWPDEIGAYRGALVLPQAPGGRILLQLRDDIGGIAMPGKWGLFGGEVEPGEALQEAAQREFEEETGLACRLRDFRPAYAVLTGAPRWGLLHIFALDLAAPLRDIRLTEGSGFALATRAQAERLDLIWYIRDVLEDYWTENDIFCEETG